MAWEPHMQNNCFLHECFCMDSNILVWRHRSQAHFQSVGMWRRWNGRYANTVVGAVTDIHGYRRIRVSLNGKRIRIYEHRLVYFLAYGIWPAEIDHINLDKQDNRIENLRAATSRENKGNTKPRAAHGMKGICYERSRNKWKASIRHDGKKINLGRYEFAEDAMKAYATAAKKVFGSFARV